MDKINRNNCIIKVIKDHIKYIIYFTNFLLLCSFTNDFSSLGLFLSFRSVLIYHPRNKQQSPSSIVNPMFFSLLSFSIKTSSLSIEYTTACK